MGSDESPTAQPCATEADALAFMRLVHILEAANKDRATSALDLRQRLVIQGLGLWGPTTTAVVGQRLGVSPSTMTGLVDRLQDAGYLRRRTHDNDRRATLLTLTAKGTRAFTGEKDYYRQLINQILTPLGPATMSTVLAALARLSDNPETRPRP